MFDNPLGTLPAHPGTVITLADDELRVDAIGYRSIKQQAEAYVYGGANLRAWRSGAFDSDFLPADAKLFEEQVFPLSKFSDWQDAQEYADKVELQMEERIALRDKLLKEKADKEKAAAPIIPSPTNPPAPDKTPVLPPTGVPELAK